MFDSMLHSDNMLLNFLAHRSFSDCLSTIGNNFAFIVSKYSVPRVTYIDIKKVIKIINNSVRYSIDERIIVTCIKELRSYIDGTLTVNSFTLDDAMELIQYLSIL